ncbi:hypothetical protein KAU88_07610 [Candidatus Bathyarchaeota archaeon]|nr:hypothetical protein [Candidatus Bathyarchaeota archaeon]
MADPKPALALLVIVGLVSLFCWIALPQVMRSATTIHGNVAFQISTYVLFAVPLLLVGLVGFILFVKSRESD